jgi:hypothetical protein
MFLAKIIDSPLSFPDKTGYHIIYHHGLIMVAKNHPHEYFDWYS